jgi:hypothetical protein
MPLVSRPTVTHDEDSSRYCQTNCPHKEGHISWTNKLHILSQPVCPLCESYEEFIGYPQCSFLVDLIYLQGINKLHTFLSVVKKSITHSDNVFFHNVIFTSRHIIDLYEIEAFYTEHVECILNYRLIIHG